LWRLNQLATGKAAQLAANHKHQVITYCRKAPTSISTIVVRAKNERKSKTVESGLFRQLSKIIYAAFRLEQVCLGKPGRDIKGKRLIARGFR
jgi:hypothetical protein